MQRPCRMTIFEQRLKDAFEEHHGKGQLCALIVATPHLPSKDRPYAMYGVRAGRNPWELIHELEQARSYKTVIALDMNSPKKLAEQFPDWLPGTISMPSQFVPLPVIAIPPEDVGARAVRHHSNGGVSDAPSFIRGVIRNDL